MKTAYLIIGLIALCTQSVFSQISSGGTPPSFSEEFNSSVKAVEEINQHVVKAPNRAQLDLEDSQVAEKGGMYRVAVNQPVSLNTENSGTWETLPNGDRIWRLRIYSKDAKALGVYYNEKIWLPQGGMLFIYNKNHKQVIGAYTAELNNEVNTIYANEMIQGDELTLEYYSPASVTKDPKINISEVAYFYRGVEDHVKYFMDKDQFEAIEKAQGCQVNVVCSEGNGWQDEIDATVHYTFVDGGGTYVCSGAMIANTAADCTPYLLTANHCGDKTSTSQFNSNVWYFKYENPNCSPGATSQYPKPSSTMTGAIFRASSMNGSHQASSNQVYGSDFTLVELNTQPPASYQVYYAGWDRRNNAATSGKGIHHPAGHDKKISTYTSSLSSATYNGGLSNAHWEVVWAPTANGHGVTEGGSSGSPLFNQDHRIVGDLSGGSSYCTSPYSSDLYGKLYYSWDILSSNASGQLKAWLDPGNTGAQYINGMRPPCSSSSTCSATISSFPYSEGFEAGTGQWAQVASDDIDWTNQSGGTPSSGTGPSGAFEGSRYMYIEASSPNYPSKSAQLISPCFDLSGISSPTLTFSYHMYGAAMGSLSVDVSDDNGATWTTGVWSVSGDQTNVWKNATVNLNSFAGSTIMVRLSGLTGSNYTSDICIDAMSLQGAVAPPPPPTGCSSTVSSFPYTEGFESGAGQWSQVASDDLDWTNQSGGTPSSGTGPSGANEGSRYMYIEASSPNYPSKSAQLISPCFDLSGLSSPTLSFSYHMYGAAMGSLSVDVSEDNGASWTTGVWSVSGDQTNVWKNATVNLNSYAGSTIMVRLSGLTGSNYTSDICIDAMSLQGAVAPPPPPTGCSSTVSSFPYTEGFEAGAGQWSQVASDDLDWTNQSGGTPSSGTGPSGANEGSRYMYIEASSPNYPSKSAQLISPCFDLSGISGAELTFTYHMYGAAMGSLSVDVSTDAGATWTNNVWNKSGDQTNVWKSASVSLSSYSGSSVMIRFSGLTGSSYTSDICIDAVSIQASTPTLTYCTPVPSNGTTDGDYIGGVALGSISNLNNGGTNTAAYKDYTSSFSTNLNRSSSQSLTVVEGAYSPDRYAAWIDYNQDGDFNDAGEKLGEFTGNAAGSSHTISFSVPAGATLGTTRMRVRCLYNGNTNGVDPCVNGDYGETEDYTVVIKDGSKTIAARSMQITEDVQVYPNPTSGDVFVRFTTSESAQVKLEIKDLAGKTVFAESSETSNGAFYKEINLSGKASGVYLLIIELPNERITERIVLK